MCFTAKEDLKLHSFNCFLFHNINFNQSNLVQFIFLHWSEPDLIYRCRCMCGLDRMFHYFHVMAAERESFISNERVPLPFSSKAAANSMPVNSHDIKKNKESL